MEYPFYENKSHVSICSSLSHDSQSPSDSDGIASKHSQFFNLQLQIGLLS